MQFASSQRRKLKVFLSYSVWKYKRRRTFVIELLLLMFEYGDNYVNGSHSRIHSFHAQTYIEMENSILRNVWICLPLHIACTFPITSITLKVRFDGRQSAYHNTNTGILRKNKKQSFSPSKHQHAVSYPKYHHIASALCYPLSSYNNNTLSVN